MDVFTLSIGDLIHPLGDLIVRRSGADSRSSFLPQINPLALVLAVSVVLGLMHLYQKWCGVTSTAVSGLLLTKLYVVTGSLLLPAVIHSLGKLQAAVISVPRRSDRWGPQEQQP
jgi:hypothetical protein